jgi:hypothetical protein
MGVRTTPPSLGAQAFGCLTSNISSSRKKRAPIVKNTKIHKNKGYKRGLNLTFKTNNKTRLCDSKIKT